MHELMSVRDLRERVLLLRAIGDIGNLDDRALSSMAEHARERYFDAGEALLISGVPTEEVHIVISGTVEVLYKKQQLARVSRGGGVGFVTLLAGDPDGVDAIAHEGPCRTLCVPAVAIFEAFEFNFSLVRDSLRLSGVELLKRRRGLPPGVAERESAPIEGRPPGRESTLIEHLMELRKSALFADVHLDALVHLASSFELSRFKAGDVLWRAGEQAMFWYRLSYGRARCVSRRGDREVFISAPFVVGVFDALAQIDREYTVVADTEVVAYRVEIETFLAAMETHHELAMRLIGAMNQMVIRSGAGPFASV